MPRMEPNPPPVKSEEERIRENRARKIEDKTEKACSFLNIVFTQDSQR